MKRNGEGGEMNIDESFDKSIRDAILKRITEIAEREAQRMLAEYQNIMIKNLKDCAAKATVEIFNFVKFERMGSELVIRVEFNNDSQAKKP